MNTAGNQLPSDLASNPSSSANHSLRSDLEYPADTDAFEIEQESAKLQAEVHKLSRELEELMNSRRFGDTKARIEDVDEGKPAGDEGEHSFNEEDEEGRGTSRFPMDDDRPERVENRPQKRESPSFPQSSSRLHAPESFSPTKFDSFGANAPRPPPSPAEKPRPSTDPNTQQTPLKDINERLQKQGFQTIPMSEDAPAVDTDTVLDRLSTVLMDFSRSIEALDLAEKRIEVLLGEKEHLQRELKRGEAKPEVSDKAGKDWERQTATWKAKLETAQTMIREKDSLVEELKERLADEMESDMPGFDREKSIFRRYFGREPRSAMDSKVVSLIHSYEDRKQRHTPEPAEIPKSSKDKVKKLKAKLQQQSVELEKVEQKAKSMSEENARLRAKQSIDSLSSTGSEVLAQAMSILQLKREKQLPIALTKMQQVIRALPGLETFIKSVSAEVLNGDASAQSIESVLPTIRTWKQKAVLWESVQSTRRQLCHLLRLDQSSDFSEIVRSHTAKCNAAGRHEQ